MRRGKSDWLLIAIGGLLGAFVGLALGFFTLADGPGTLNPVDCHAVKWNEPGKPAELHVELFGQWKYSRTAPNVRDFDTEMMLLRLGPAAFVLGLSFALGVQAGAMAGRWARRRRQSSAMQSAKEAAG